MVNSEERSKKGNIKAEIGVGRENFPLYWN
jgi:hypothetical protein